MIRKKNSKFWLARRNHLVSIGAILAVSVLSLVIPMEKLTCTARKNLDTIRFYHPYRPVLPMDPRKLYSVGDQVLSEHIFPFHGRESMRDGFQPVFSDIQFDYTQNTVTIRPLYSLKRSDGTELSMKEICSTFESSLQGTQHVPYRSIFLNLECRPNEVILKFKKIPVNLKYLFTLADFSVYEASRLPITEKSIPITAGPYQIKKIEERKVWLKRNPYFPKELTANHVEHAIFQAYNAGELSGFLNDLDPEKDHLIYINGNRFSEDLEKKLKQKKYRLSFFPSEWLTYIELSNRVNDNDRFLIGEALDEAKAKILSQTNIGTAAFSISPTDSPFGLTQEDYQSIIQKIKIKSNKLSRNYIFGILSNFDQTPVGRIIVDTLKSRFKEIQFKNVVFKDAQSYWKEVDIDCASLGLSAADPLNHLSFIRDYSPSFRNFLPETRLAEVATLDHADQFIAAVKKIEAEVVAKRLLIPIAHFPGVVAEAPGFERDERLAWSWGTQAWTYRIR